MASKEHKIVRRAEAMAELSVLSDQLAKRLNIEAVNVNTTNRDTELAEIQRIETVNGLLALVVQVLDAEKAQAAETEKKPAVRRTHGPR